MNKRKRSSVITILINIHLMIFSQQTEIKRDIHCLKRKKKIV